jgi:predicted RNA-binding Zn ribbon-like protein
VSSPIHKRAEEPDAKLLVAFVNTLDVEEGADAIAEPQQLEAWIEEATGEPAGEVGAEELDRILALRESLRAMLRVNNGATGVEVALQPMREAAERSRYRTALSEDGQVSMLPARSGLSGFEARLLLAIERLQSGGAWSRLKACTEDECQWAFYDTTKNRSRTWCSMDVCGNREKTRRYRRRKGTAR